MDISTLLEVIAGNGIGAVFAVIIFWIYREEKTSHVNDIKELHARNAQILEKQSETLATLTNTVTRMHETMSIATQIQDLLNR